MGKKRSEISKQVKSKATASYTDNPESECFPEEMVEIEMLNHRGLTNSNDEQ